jgi:hypothetical protein
MIRLGHWSPDSCACSSDNLHRRVLQFIGTVRPRHGEWLCLQNSRCRDVIDKADASSTSPAIFMVSVRREPTPCRLSGMATNHPGELTATLFVPADADLNGGPNPRPHRHHTESGMVEIGGRWRADVSGPFDSNPLPRTHESNVACDPIRNRTKSRDLIPFSGRAISASGRRGRWRPLLPPSG